MENCYGLYISWTGGMGIVGLKMDENGFTNRFAPDLALSLYTNKGVVFCDNIHAVWGPSHTLAYDKDKQDNTLGGKNEVAEFLTGKPIWGDVIIYCSDGMTQDEVAELAHNINWKMVNNDIRKQAEMSRYADPVY